MKMRKVKMVLPGGSTRVNQRLKWAPYPLKQPYRFAEDELAASLTALHVVANDDGDHETRATSAIPGIEIESMILPVDFDQTLALNGSHVDFDEMLALTGSHVDIDEMLALTELYVDFDAMLALTAPNVDVDELHQPPEAERWLLYFNEQDEDSKRRLDAMWCSAALSVISPEHVCQVGTLAKTEKPSTLHEFIRDCQCWDCSRMKTRQEALSLAPVLN